MLNFIWSGFFLAAFAAALYQSLGLDNAAIWTELVNSTFASAKSAFQICPECFACGSGCLKLPSGPELPTCWPKRWRHCFGEFFPVFRLTAPLWDQSL